MKRILAFSGSSRRGSYNRLALDCLARMAGEAGVAVDIVDLASLELPIYNADLEADTGLPAGAASLRDQLSECQGMIVACPEYNGFVTPLLLNTIDWTTRSPNGRPDPGVFANKVVLVASASPGAFGGSRAAGHLRTLLSGIGCLVMPQTVIVPGAHQGFSEDGSLMNEQVADRARGAVAQLVDLLAKLA